MQHTFRIPIAAATLLSAVLVAACGGSSPSRTTTATTSGGASTPASTVAAGTTTTSSSSAATGGDSASSPGLAFARCMRANGVTNFPDPTPGQGLRFQTGNGVSPQSPAFRAAQQKCMKLLPGLPGPGSTTHPSAATMAKLRRIAVCMRGHGVPQFPDPRTSVPANPLQEGFTEITDFDGAILLFPATVNMQAPAYRQALSACGAPPLGLPH